jgi:hypothetical protein
MDEAGPLTELISRHSGDGHFPGTSGAQPRMWFQTRTWDGEMPVTAPDDFIAWADRVLGLVRRNWVLIDDSYRFSPAAAEAWEAQWQVVLGRAMAWAWCRAD